jgi:hypothetical protein
MEARLLLISSSPATLVAQLVMVNQGLWAGWPSPSTTSDRIALKGRGEAVRSIWSPSLAGPLPVFAHHKPTGRGSLVINRRGSVVRS